MEENDSDSVISNSEIAECKKEIRKKPQHGESLKKNYRLGVEKSALNRRARKEQRQLEQAKELASMDLEKQIKEAELDLKMRQNALRLKSLEKSIAGIKNKSSPIEQENSTEEDEIVPVKVVKKKKPKKMIIVNPTTETEESEIEPKIFKKELVKRQVEQKVDTLRDEIIKKYMNNLFPRY